MEIMKELADSFDKILKSDMCYEEQLETLLQVTRAKFSMDATKTITLDNVILQKNGILRDANGLLIARLVDSVKFDDIENSLKIAENKVRIKEDQQFYLALTMAEEKKRLEELEFRNLNRKKGE